MPSPKRAYWGSWADNSLVFSFLPHLAVIRIYDQNSQESGLYPVVQLHSFPIRSQFYSERSAYSLTTQSLFLILDNFPHHRPEIFPVFIFVIPIQVNVKFIVCLCQCLADVNKYSCYVDRTVGFVLVQVLLLLHKPIILLLSLFMNLLGGPFQFIVSNCLSI